MNPSLRYSPLIFISFSEKSIFFQYIRLKINSIFYIINKSIVMKPDQKLTPRRRAIFGSHENEVSLS